MTKKILFILLMLSAMVNTSWSQVDVYFRLNHLLGSTDFSATHVASNNLNNDFMVERLDYYISEVTLIHDGGQRTKVVGLYILVDALAQTNELLGNFNITTLEAVEFGIGVDGSVNNSDITLFPPDHPLSFQLPSMHWGWASGYRFVAMEGRSGTSMSSNWELHALGNANYGYAVVSTAGTMDGNDLIVALDADYEQALSNITVSGSLNYHGENQQAATILTNFQNLVFSEGNARIGTPETLTQALSISPNPSTGKVYLELGSDSYTDAVVSVRDLTGRLIFKESIKAYANLEINLEHQGVYLVTLEDKGNLIGSSKLIIQ